MIGPPCYAEKHPHPNYADAYRADPARCWHFLDFLGNLATKKDYGNGFHCELPRHHAGDHVVRVLAVTGEADEVPRCPEIDYRPIVSEVEIRWRAEAAVQANGKVHA